MSNYNKLSIKEQPRTELHDGLKLTGAEISVNVLPAGTSVPFVHSHKHNEEIYAVIEGEGRVVIDGESVPLTEGDWLRISPAAKRQIFASDKAAIKYLCIQVKANSLEGYTMTDAVV